MWTFAGVLVVGTIGLAVINRVVGYARIHSVAVGTPDPAPGYYLANSTNAVDFFVLHRGSRGTRAAMRAADLIFAGNSRLAFALPRRHLDPLMVAAQVKPYVLAFGQGQGNVFIEHLIERHDLRPGFVVVNADEFFTDIPSGGARRVMRSHGFEAWREAMEVEASHRIRRQLHRLYPHFERRAADWVIHRSVDVGDWRDVGHRGRSAPVQDEPDPFEGVEDVELAIAERFRDLVVARGGSLVLIYVPAAGRNKRERARAIAARLGVPFVSPVVRGLRSFDGSHLDAASVDAFTPKLFAELTRVLEGLR